MCSSDLYDENRKECIEFKNNLKLIIEEYIKNGYTEFISGMALGVDTLCAEIVLELKDKYPDIKLECAIPCLNQSEKWSDNQKKRYIEILSKSDKVNYISKCNYTKNCMNDRNKYLVDNADALIAVWNGKPSGTFNTIKMAKAINIPIKILYI